MDTDNPTTPIENLYPALTQCFAVILCGYIAGRVNLISETEAKGIGTFVGTFSLPALIFMSLADLELAQVNWVFLLSILVAKSVVFFAVIIITLLVTRPLKYDTAGIFAIFCTQSNDFAIGFPIVAALYKHTHPEYAVYLYLMAPISLSILNPIAFILMEIEKRRGIHGSHELLINDAESPNATNLQKHWIYMIFSVAKGIFANPVIVMTILGILGNFIFKHTVPIYLGDTLQALGSAFSASALFLLGLRMVGKVHKLTGASLVVPGILIMVKLIVLPLVTREMISILHPGNNETETTDLSTYGFLYGTFPSAPGVFVFASQYSTNVDLVATAMVACTFISAPLMFISAKMITLTNCNPSDYIKQLNNFNFDISIIGLITSAWVLAVFVLTKKILRIPHKITACLVISQFISCLGVILWNALNKNGWAGYIQFTLFTVGVYSSRLWTMILAITLLFLQCRSLCFVLKLQPIFIVVGWGLPIVLSTLIVVFEPTSDLPYEKRNPNFVYGPSQAIIAVSLLVLCFIATIGCLILHQRYAKRLTRFVNLVNDLAFDPEGSPSGSDINSASPSNASSGRSSDSGVVSSRAQKSGLSTIPEGQCESKESPVVDIEDILDGFQTNRPLSENADSRGVCSSKFGCSGGTNHVCQGTVQQYQEQIDEDLELIEEESESHDPQILRHIVLLILSLCSLFVGLALSIWTLVMEHMSGIYIELSFLDATLNFGQSIIIFAIFGLDTKEILLPIVKYWRKIWYGANKLTLPEWQDLSSETKHLCEQFIKHHLQNCQSAIAVDKRWRLKIYRNVFSGEDLVNWLIEVGLARDRIEAVNYARHLVDGKVLKHINEVYHFYDRKLLYTFV